MKHVIIKFTLAILVLSLASFKAGTENVFMTDGKRIEVVFNHRLSFNDLVKMKLDLSEKNIMLNFRNLGFDENSLLVSIDYTVQCNKVGGGDQLENLTDESNFGFILDNSKNAKFDFACGDLNKIKKQFNLN